MKVYQLSKTQILNTTLEEAWEFFSTPKNLNEITPEDMNFQILEGSDESMFAGQIIRYKINPIANIPLSWVTEITHCQPKKYFIDEQRFGPYKLWHHLHRFTEIEEGVLMEDVLHYALPLGGIGRLIAGKFVEKKVNNIFNYRFNKLEKIFNKKSLKNKSFKQSIA
jgi:ligand-binding SRPBCC domain-containing protein